TRLISPYYGSCPHCRAAPIHVTLAALGARPAGGGPPAHRAPAPAPAPRPPARPAPGPPRPPPPPRPDPPARPPPPAHQRPAGARVEQRARAPEGVRRAHGEWGVVGRRTGEIHATSTVGGVFGAGLAGFVLIPRLPLSQILHGMALALLLLSGWAHWLSQERL